MKWSIRLFLCFVVCGSYQFCSGTRFDDFIQEEHDFLQEVDRLFYTHYDNKAPQLHADEPYVNPNQNEQPVMAHNGPIPSPEWSLDLSATDDFLETTGESDGLFPILFDDFATEVDNYRPRDDGSGGPIHSENHETSSEKYDYAGSGDDEGTESYEEFGSGDNKIDDTTSGSHFLQTTSIPVETTTSVYHQCGQHIKSEIVSCIKLSLSLRTLLYEMGHNIVDTGYYNVSSNNAYLAHLFRTCTSTIDTPPRCLATDGDDGIVEIVTHGIIVFASEKGNEQIDEVVVEEGSFSCFSAHLYTLRSCLSLRLDLKQLENLVKIVSLKTGEALVEDCQAFQEVRGCLVWSMRRCDDSTSVVLVEDMFEATLRGIETCSGQHVSSAEEVMSLGAVFTLATSILIARF